MLPKGLRLRRSGDFARVYKEGRFVHSGLLTLHVLRRGDEDLPRIGFVAGKKVGGIAKRNLFKRRTRAVVEERHRYWQRGIDLIFVLRPAIATAEFGEIEFAVEDLARRAGIVG